MYNIGQIMRKLSRFADAFSWWWKALQIQPSYWDVVVRPKYYHLIAFHIDTQFSGQHLGNGPFLGSCCKSNHGNRSNQGRSCSIL